MILSEQISFFQKKQAIVFQQPFKCGLASATRGTAPFLERYFHPSRDRLAVVRPGDAVSCARGLYALFAGRPVDRLVWDRFEGLALEVTGAQSFATHQAVAEWRARETRPTLGSYGARMSADATRGSVVRLGLDNLRDEQIMAPTHVGKAAGDPDGVRVLRAAIAFKAYERARLRAKPGSPVAVADVAESEPQPAASPTAAAQSDDRPTTPPPTDDDVLQVDLPDNIEDAVGTISDLHPTDDGRGLFDSRDERLGHSRAWLKAYRAADKIAAWIAAVAPWAGEGCYWQVAGRDSDDQSLAEGAYGFTPLLCTTTGLVLRRQHHDVFGKQ